jgi:hypothetical protein
MFSPFRRAATIVLACISSAVPTAVAQPTPLLQPRSATQELSYLASRHRDRIAGVIYLEAAYRSRLGPLLTAKRCLRSSPEASQSFSRQSLTHRTESAICFMPPL